MVSATMELMEAQATLDAAKAQAAAEQREQLVSQLRSTRTRIRTLTTELTKLRGFVKTHDGKTALLRTKVSELQRLVNISYNQKPSIADVLPDDDEAVEWGRNHRRLTAQHDAAVKELQRHGTVDPDRVRAVQMNHDLLQLRRSEENLLAKLQGRALGKAREGGLSAV